MDSLRKWKKQYFCTIYSDHRFRYEKCNFSKKYRYYYDNEVKIIDYCERESIKEFVPKNHPDRKLNDLPMPLISFKSVSFSERLNLVKPSDISAAEFEKCISELLFRKYPDLEKYQMLADEINETYYAQYPELAIRFIPRFTWYKDKPAIRKIGIRATNQCVSASNSDTADNRMSKRELLDKYGLNLSKDVKSSVPRITLSLNQHLWEKESTDIYDAFYARKEGITQEAFERYVEALVEKKANAYIQRYYEIKDKTVAS